MTADTLIARLESAGEGSQTLNVAIHRACGLPFVMEYWTESDTKPVENLSQVPRYTTSLDAAIALVTRLLPGWKRQIFEDFTGRWIARVTSPRRDTFSTDYMRDREPSGSPNGAIALVLAALRALEAKEC